MNRTYRARRYVLSPIWAGESAPSRKAIAPSLFFRTTRGTNTAPPSLWRPFPAKWTPRPSCPPTIFSRRKTGWNCLLSFFWNSSARLTRNGWRVHWTSGGKAYPQNQPRLAVSVGLIEEVPENLIMCLCPACANNFYGTGSYYLRRVHPERVEKDICTYCGQRPGFDYEVVRRNGHDNGKGGLR